MIPVGGPVYVLLSDRTRERSLEKMRADFVANSSHELRTPLASLIGFIETLRGPAADDPVAQKRFLGIMAEQAARMQRMIADLLSLPSSIPLFPLPPSLPSPPPPPPPPLLPPPTTCLNIGCIPSKALLHASELYEEAGHGFEAMGIKAITELDLPAMMKYKTEGVRATSRASSTS